MCIMQNDGNFVVYTSQWTDVWSTMGKTTNSGGFSGVNMYTLDAVANAKKWLYPPVSYSDETYQDTFYGSYIANSAGFIAYAW